MSKILWIVNGKIFISVLLAGLAIHSFGMMRAEAFEACQPASPTFASPKSNHAVTIRITADQNIGKHSWGVNIFWIDFNGNYIRMGNTLFPTQVFNQKTYNGHIWVAKDAHNQCQYFIAKPGWNFFHVKY